MPKRELGHEGGRDGTPCRPGRAKRGGGRMEGKLAASPPTGRGKFAAPAASLALARRTARSAVPTRLRCAQVKRGLDFREKTPPEKLLPIVSPSRRLAVSPDDGSAVPPCGPGNLRTPRWGLGEPSCCEGRGRRLGKRSARRQWICLRKGKIVLRGGAGAGEAGSFPYSATRFLDAP